VNPDINKIVKDVSKRLEPIMRALAEYDRTHGTEKDRNEYAEFMSGKYPGKEWWEFLDWSRMKVTYNMITDMQLKRKIGAKGYWSLGIGVFENDSHD